MRIFCSICKDIFIPYSEVHVTNCGHLYHGNCISTWIKQHRTCPQCRAKLSQPFRVFFDVEKDNETDSSTLEHQVETLSDKLRETEKQKNNLLQDNKNYEKIVSGMKECAVSLSKKNDVLKTSVKALKKQVSNLSNLSEAVTRLENEVETWKKKVSTLEKVETLIKGSAEEVNKMIESTPVTELSVKHLCIYVGILKAQLHKIESRNVKLAKENKDLNRTIAEEKKKNSVDSEEVINNLKASNKKLEDELLHLRMLHKNCEKKISEKNETGTSQNNISQLKMINSVVTLDFEKDDERRKNEVVKPAESDKRITQWEELVCAGPSRNFGLSLKMSKSLSKSLYCNNKELDISNRSSSSYVFDGLGGRKKLRLGNPTPLEEFEKIKKKKENQPEPAFRHKKIIEYYQLA